MPSLSPVLHLPLLFLRVTLCPRSDPACRCWKGWAGAARACDSFIILESSAMSLEEDASLEVTKRLTLHLLSLAAPTLYTLNVRVGILIMSTSLLGCVFRLPFPLL
ncbi:hypothetical protein BDQ12DRAFT_682691 [Crucibulum laeve]|uniref:Secreted protein n=1 Tax=Crucibulum laeve TaxID=68775 RepID=A0A5C3M1Q3_9AGAR|nr:hypothetical protein BDQ12DRAFT_682691 [Crucibulum laeve]